MSRAAIIFAAAVGASGLAGAAMCSQEVRVVCSGPGDSRLSADMDIRDALQTSTGWVLYFPHRADSERRVEIWDACEVHQ